MDNETLIAENVEVDMETLSDAIVAPVQLTRDRARHMIIQSILQALSPEERKRLEEFINQ